jgi:hypothetical protein
VFIEGPPEKYEVARQMIEDIVAEVECVNVATEA